MSVPLKGQKTAEEREARRVRCRALTIKELIETEAVYVHHLQVLNKVYIEPLSVNNIINAEQHKLLFGRIVEICKLHEQFSNHLSERYNNWESEFSKISDIFDLFIPYFNMYQPYLINYEKAIKLRSQLYIQSSKFKKFVDEARRIPMCNGLDIVSYLCMPLGRIPRYILLLRTLIKNTLSDHPDYKDLQQSHTKLNVLSMKINETMKKFGQRQKLMDLESSFSQKINLVFADRYFVMEGELTKICKRKDISYVFILCSDLLIYGQIKKNKIKIHEQIVINELFEIRNVSQNVKYGDKCWEIRSAQSSFVVYAENTALKHEWYVQMEKVMKSSHSRHLIKCSGQKTAALYVPGDFTVQCMVRTCDMKFTPKNKKYCCTYCGYLVCAKCSSQKLPHWNKRNKLVTVCQMCYDQYK